jgi:hypothetical protein
MADASTKQQASRVTLGTNPKDLIGNKKVSITKLPMVGVIHGAHAMMDGARKYGPYNWRGNAVVASIYVDAAMRHLMAYFEGEQEAPDSGVHHLGHVIACAAILLDAETTHNLVDDRPISQYIGAASLLLEELNAKVKAADAARTSSPPRGDGPFSLSSDTNVLAGVKG